MRAHMLSLLDSSSAYSLTFLKGSPPQSTRFSHLMMLFVFAMTMLAGCGSYYPIADQEDDDQEGMSSPSRISTRCLAVCLTR